jgi:hypothetical protein
VVINPDKTLKDRIVINLSNEKVETTLIHYERTTRVCLCCSKLGHEVEQCDERINLLSRIKTYPPELHELLNEKIRSNCGGWISKLYLLDKCVLNLNANPPEHESYGKTDESWGYGGAGRTELGSTAIGTNRYYMAENRMKRGRETRIENSDQLIELADGTSSGAYQTDYG